MTKCAFLQNNSTLCLLLLDQKEKAYSSILMTEDIITLGRLHSEHVINRHLVNPVIKRLKPVIMDHLLILFEMRHTI